MINVAPNKPVFIDVDF